jgi:hypothetical protein
MAEATVTRAPGRPRFRPSATKTAMPPQPPLEVTVVKNAAEHHSIARRMTPSFKPSAR